MNYIIVDTSSILFGFSNKRDVFEIAKVSFPGYKLLISIGILNELSGISKNMGKRGLSSRTATQSIRYKRIDVDNNKQEVDSWIYAKSQQYPHSVVITNDTALYKKLRSAGVKALKLTKSGLLR